MSPERYAKLQAVLNRRQPDLTVCMDGVHKPHNLSAIARTADSVGIGTVHGVRYAGPKSNDRYRSRRTRNSRGGLTQRASGGSKHYLQTIIHPDINTAYTALKTQGMQLVVTHFDDQAVDYRQIDYSKPTAIVMGMELDGVSDEAVAAADHSVTIPMVGMVQSLNVSVATALILYEALRQREAAGLYAQRRISDEEFEHKLFHWSYPKIAEHCDRKGLSYPRLDEDGYLVKT